MTEGVQSRGSADREYRLGLLLVLVAAFAWSLGGLYAKLVTVGGFTTLFWRGLFGCLSLLTVLLWRDARGVVADLARLGAPGWFYAVCSAGGMTCYLVSIQYTSIAHNSIIWALVPLATALAAWTFLGERISLPTIVASLMALGGVAVMLWGSAGEGDAFGDFLSVLMMLSGVVMILVSRRYRRLPFAAAGMVASLLSSLLAWPFAHPASATWRDIGILAVFGVTQGAVGMVLFGLGARRIPSADAALISALEGPLGPLWVFLALGIVPLPGTMIGGAIVIATVVGHILIESRRHPASRAVPSSDGQNRG
mgnify:CR=1 FL=1